MANDKLSNFTTQVTTLAGTERMEFTQGGVTKYGLPSDLSAYTGTATLTLTNKTLDSFTNSVMADTVHEQVRNSSGATLTKGTPVAVSGFHVGSGLTEVDEADADTAANMPAVGIVQEDISNNANGAIIELGHLDGLDTSSYSVGDALYVSETAGELTDTRPTAAATGVQKVAEVLRSHVSAGVIEVFGAGRTNDIPNRMSTAHIRIADGSDLTKVAMFDATAITTATTRTVTLPDANVDLGDVSKDYIIVALGDETTAVTTGTGKVSMRMPHAFTLSAVRLSAVTAPTGATLIVDINEGGTTVLSTKLSIDIGERTSTTAASAAVISDSALADDAEMTFDIDQIGSTIAGAGLKVILIGSRA